MSVTRARNIYGIEGRDFAPRGPGGGGAAAAHVTPIFIPRDILKVWILSVVLSIAAGIFPAWKASRLSPLEALRR